MSHIIGHHDASSNRLALVIPLVFPPLKCKNPRLVGRGFLA